MPIPFQIPRLLPAIGLLTLLGAASCTKDHPMAAQTLTDSVYNNRLQFLIQDNFTFSTYFTGLQSTLMADTLEQGGRFTALVSGNSGFSASPWGVPSATYILSNWTQTYAEDFFRYSILDGSYSMDSLPLGDDQELPTVGGFHVYVSKYVRGTDTTVTINGAVLSGMDQAATNGLLQALSQPINPEESHTLSDCIHNDQTLTLFAAAMDRVHADTLLAGPGPYTVLAPVNATFKALAGLGEGLSTMDSLLAADTAVLGPLVRGQILYGRYFLNDLLRKYDGTDTVLLPAADGKSVRFFEGAPEPWEAPVPSFLGTSATGTPTQIASAVWPVLQDLGDIPAGNGVVQKINQVLMP